MFLIAFKVDWTQSRDKRLVLMVRNAMRPRSPLSHLMIKSLFFYQTLASPGGVAHKLLLTLTFQRKVIFASHHQVLVGCSDIRVLPAVPSNFPLLTLTFSPPLGLHFVCLFAQIWLHNFLENHFLPVILLSKNFYIKSTWTPALKHVTRNSYDMP